MQQVSSDVNITAIIKSPTGEVYTVPVKEMDISHSSIAITAEDGRTFMTHLSNILLIQEENVCGK